MDSTIVHKLLVLYVPVLVTAGLLLVALRNYYCRGLNRYPGPWLPNFTDLWHWLDVQSNQHHNHLIQLHRRYGDFVRIGPNKISISRPDFVPIVYGVSTGFHKVVSNSQDTRMTME